MPNFSDYSPEGLMLLLQPWISNDRLPPNATMPTFKPDKNYYGFKKKDEKLFFTDYAKDFRTNEPTLVTNENCQGIFEKIMQPNAYIVLKTNPVQLLPAKEIFEQTIKKTTDAVTAEDLLTLVLPPIIAGYSLEKEQIEQAIAEHSRKEEKQIKQAISVGLFKAKIKPEPQEPPSLLEKTPPESLTKPECCIIS